METFSALLALCAGNSPVPVNSPHKGQWRGALMFALIYAWINDWVNNREAGDLRRRCGHYDVIVMTWKISLRYCTVAFHDMMTQRDRQGTSWSEYHGSVPEGLIFSLFNISLHKRSDNTSKIPTNSKLSGPHVNMSTVSLGIGIFYIKMRRPWDCLIFIMRIPILVGL